MSAITRAQSRTLYRHLVYLIDQAIVEAGEARGAHDLDHADWLMGHADLLESQLLDLADRFDLD